MKVDIKMKNKKHKIAREKHKIEKNNLSRYTSQNGSAKTTHPGLEMMRGGHAEVVARPSVLLTIAQPELKTCQPGYNS